MAVFVILEVRSPKSLWASCGRCLATIQQGIWLCMIGRMKHSGKDNSGETVPSHLHGQPAAALVSNQISLCQAEIIFVRHHASSVGGPSAAPAKAVHSVCTHHRVIGKEASGHRVLLSSVQLHRPWYACTSAVDSISDNCFQFVSALTTPSRALRFLSACCGKLSRGQSQPAAADVLELGCYVETHPAGLP